MQEPAISSRLLLYHGEFGICPNVVWPVSIDSAACTRYHYSIALCALEGERMLLEYYRPTIAEISLDALTHNIAAFRQRVGSNTMLLATVKANAYGHGAVETAREAAAAGVDYLGVAFLDEALQLRKAGISMPILVFGFTPVSGLQAARDHDITVTIYREDVLAAIEQFGSGWAREGRKLKVHIKIDSGMGRLGLLPGRAAELFMERACRAPGLVVEGLFTHYARADESDKTYTSMQAERFAGFVDYVRRHALPVEVIHASNSAAGIDLPEQTSGMLRLGISMYGLYPSAEVNRKNVDLAPVMSLKTELVHVKQLAPGEGISYGTRYFTQHCETIGTLPIGYADGFSRMLSGKAQALFRGRRVPVVGTICMDQCMVRLDEALALDAPVAVPGEEVVLIGQQGQARITADDVADQLNTINYEITCMIAARVPRVYRKNGEIVAIVNPLVE